MVLGQTISFDAQLEVGGLTESITVTGDSPLVDTSTTTIGTNLKGDELIAVPNSTDVWGALSESPGVRMQGFDVGGSHKSQQSGYEVFGIQSQARTVSDGVDHTEGVGGTGFYEDYYANEEVSVSALGADVEMNSGGAAIVTTIKSGGNTFKGLEHLSYQPGSFVGSNAAPERHQRATATPARTTPRDSRSATTRTCCSGKGISISAARSSATSPGSTAPTTTSRSTSRWRASAVTWPPTSASSTTTPARAP